MHATTLHLGLDVHRDSITLAVAQSGPQRELRLFGTITKDLHALEKALTRIREGHPPAPTWRSEWDGDGTSRRSGAGVCTQR